MFLDSLTFSACKERPGASERFTFPADELTRVSELQFTIFTPLLFARLLAAGLFPGSRKVNSIINHNPQVYYFREISIVRINLAIYFPNSFSI